MDGIDFSYVLSSSLTPVTLISGVGLLLRAMALRFDESIERTRELLHQKSLRGYPDAALDEEIDLIYSRTVMLGRAILLVVISAGLSSLLVFAGVVESLAGIDLETVKRILLIAAVALMVISALVFAFEVQFSLGALGISVSRPPPGRRG